MSVKSVAAHIKTREKKIETPQSIKARKDQVRNSAGGFGFTVTKWEMLDRFLILGSEGGTYHVSEQKLTQDNAKNVLSCIEEDGFAVVNRIVEISEGGRAPKNDPALLALAMCASYGDNEVKNYAMANLSKVARIGTHLFHFAEFVNSIRGWGRTLREGIANWYQGMDEVDLAFQVVKYQQRDGWSHKDLLRLSHPKADNNTRNTLYRYIVKGVEGLEKGDMIPSIIEGAEAIKTATTGEAIKLIVDYNLPREVIPTHMLNDVGVWATLVDKGMPLTAMIRNLAKMTNVGLLTTDGKNPYVSKVIETLLNQEALKKARVHPLSVLVAHAIYSQGKGDKGSLAWTPITKIKNALDEAFYLAFGAVEPANKNTLLALDLSASMTWSKVCGSSIRPREASAAMAMVAVRTEPAWEIMGFTSGNGGISRLPGIKIKSKLDEVLNIIENQSAGGTDCSLPMIWAAQNKIEVDTFCVYTDNETWAGKVHPFQALKNYRQVMDRPAKLVVVGMVSNGFTIADPTDAGMMDVVGFDTATPNIISAFSSGVF